MQKSPKYIFIYNLQKLFYPYQFRFITDPSPFKIVLKARQIGFSFAMSFEALIEALFDQRDILIFSASEDQALELMRKIRHHLRLFKEIGFKFEEKKKEIIIPIIEWNGLKPRIIAPNGPKIIVRASNPNTARGWSGSIYLDEFAFHQEARELYRAALPSITRVKGNVRIASTPNFATGMFYELWNREDIYPYFSRHKVTIWKALDEGLTLNLAGKTITGKDVPRDPDKFMRFREDLAKLLGVDLETFAREFECQFIEETGSYIPYSLIEPVISEETKKPYSGGPAFVGIDIARKRDLTVLISLEQLGDVFYTRHILELRNMPFDTQKNTIRRILMNLNLAGGAIDATGLGMQLAEELSTEFPQIEPVTFSNQVKEILAVNARIAFERRSIRIPENSHLIEAIQAIKRTITPAGNIRFDAERSEMGHADHFWALALALYAASERHALVEGGIYLDGVRRFAS